MTPARGPLNVLWVVEVTTSQNSNGEGITPAATKPLMCDISAIKYEPLALAISWKRL